LPGVIHIGRGAGDQHLHHGVGLAKTDIYVLFLAQTATQGLHAIEYRLGQFHSISPRELKLKRA
jgi:hypothetical protein